MSCVLSLFPIQELLSFMTMQIGLRKHQEIYWKHKVSMDYASNLWCPRNRNRSICCRRTDSHMPELILVCSWVGMSKIPSKMKLHCLQLLLWPWTYESLFEGTGASQISCIYEIAFFPPHREHREREIPSCFSKFYPFFHVQLKSHLVFPTTLVFITSLPDLLYYYFSVTMVTMFFWTNTLIKSISNLGTYCFK